MSRIALQRASVSSRTFNAPKIPQFLLRTQPWQASRISPQNFLRSFSAASSLREKYYTETHEWIELSPDKKTGLFGISAHAASALGDVVFVELPEPGTEVAAGDTLGAVESVKSASDLYAPIGGKVIEANSDLEEKPATINKSPEMDGWIARIELKEGEAAKVEKLMQADDYKKFSE